MINESSKSEIQLLSIRLQNSVFVRGDINDSPSDLKMKITTGHEIESSEIYVTVNVQLQSKEFPDFKIGVSMVGVFEQHDEISFPIEEFCGVNAPAIVYPYVRQHIRALSLEARIDTVVIPVVNFVSLYNNRDLD